MSKWLEGGEPGRALPLPQEALRLLQSLASPSFERAAAETAECGLTEEAVRKLASIWRERTRYAPIFVSWSNGHNLASKEPWPFQSRSC